MKAFEDLVVGPTIGGSYVYVANTVAAFLKKKAYPYLPPLEFKKYTLEETINIDLDEQCRRFIGLYDNIVKNRKFDALIFGAPNGGIVHLAAAMGIPYICSQFRVPTKISSEGKDDLRSYAEVAEFVGERWSAKCDWSSVCCLADPIHDRMDMGHYAHIRAKFIDVPPVFRDFIRKHLKLGGTLIFVNVTYPWIKHRLGDRVHLQVGGLGEIKPREYIDGSERIDKFLEAEGATHRGGWRLPEYELVERPESEWGTEPELKESVQSYCDEEGYELMCLEQNHPAGFNILAAHAMHLKHTADGGKCGGYSINIFWGLCPTMVLRARLLSCWFTFTDRESLNISERQLHRLIRDFPDVPRKAILGYYWSYPGAKVLDIVPPSGWLSMLSKYIPLEHIQTPGIADLESTEHDVFRYEDSLYEESKRYAGNESSYNVTVEDLNSLLKL